ncbi:MAG: Ig-like domain-containing protein, partial [Clostridia bacterium]|nr:Ig-like domain-containing protein [Clostridia bacterium]
AICTIVVGKKAQSISLKQTNLKLDKGESVQLDFSVSPSDATSRIYWSSSDEKVAIVNSGGTLTAVGGGTATITMYTTNNLKKTCKVTVTATLEEIHFDIDEVVIQKGEELEINVTYIPEDATNKTLVWKSSDPTVASVKDGVVKALSNGFVTITATSKDGTCVAQCRIMINNPLKSLAFEGELDKNTGKYPAISMQCTDVMKAPLIADPIDADELSELIWESSNTSILTISRDGTLTALAEGTVTIKVRSVNGLTASCDVVITRKIYKVEEIVVSSDEYFMNPGDTINIGLTYLPIESIPDAKLYKTLTTNGSVAYYNGRDSITANTPGSCEIEFWLVNYDGSEIMLTVKVTVVDAGTNLDKEYESDIHALRDGELYIGLTQALDTINRLTKEKDELVAKLSTESDPTLIEDYTIRLAEVENGIRLAGESEVYYREKLAAAEAKIKVKYSSVDTTYDPDKDTYPSIADSDFAKVSDYIENVTIDLKYAGADNETGAQIYNFTDAYLRYGTLQKLVSIAKLLEDQGYRIVIWDAYRPVKAQDMIWQYNGVTDAGSYVSSKGNTVYITIVNADGTPLEMPSQYGDSTSASDRDYGDVSTSAGANALYLETLMTANGFVAGEKWWQFTDSTDYEVENNFLSDSVASN